VRGYAVAVAEVSLEHRRFLDHRPPFRVAADASLFERVGGQAAVDALVDTLYDRFEADERLRPLFGRDLGNERANQKRFFAEWLGGPPRYQETAYAGLAHRHEHLGISRELAGRWLGHFRRALAAAVSEERDRETIFARAQSLAEALVLAANPEARAYAKAAGKRERPGDLHCGRNHPIVEATAHAHRGNVRGLRALLLKQPGALKPATRAAMAMHAAVRAGRADVVRLLLDAGVDVDKPFYLPVGTVGGAFERVIFVTPLCAARLARRRDVEALLRRAGAQDDVFSAAFLGDLSGLERHLAAAGDSELAQAVDPATDLVEITPVHHAIAGEQPAALRFLLAHTHLPLRAGTRALRGAAGKGSQEMVELLIDRGASSRDLGPGRWVLHPEIAPALARIGASVATPDGRWIGLSCTGNQGRKDDPDFVRALLARGARVDDHYHGATALHFAARAGFMRTLEVLLEQGADPDARDDAGLTPLAWVERAARTSARAPMRRLLTRR
jgi:truncated hemoglobin YjbI/ankyrin repeat protein